MCKTSIKDAGAVSKSSVVSKSDDDHDVVAELAKGFEVDMRSIKQFDSVSKDIQVMFIINEIQ